jgi:hypothetical protein
MAGGIMMGVTGGNVAFGALAAHAHSMKPIAQALAVLAM